MNVNWNFAASKQLAELMGEDVVLDPIVLVRHKAIGGMGESKRDGYLFVVMGEQNIGDVFFYLSDYSHYFNTFEFGDTLPSQRSWGISGIVVNESYEGQRICPHNTTRLELKDGYLYWDGVKLKSLKLIE